jgi:IclR family acetate operon transcriptional repressor
MGRGTVPGSDVATVVRALRALEYLAEQPVSIGQLGQLLGIDRGTAARLLTTLERSGYAERDEADGRYRLAAAKIIALYGLVEGRAELAHLAGPILAELRDLTNETANVSVLAGDEMLYVAVQRSRASVSAAFGLGRRVTVHNSAIGKSYIAFQPEAEVTALLERKGMTAFTARTITTWEELRTQLELIRRLGYAIDDEEGEYGMRCLAAPVRDFRGRVIASLGISGPTTRLTLRRVHELTEPVKAAAGRLSVALGWEQGHAGGSAAAMTVAGNGRRPGDSRR